MELGLISFILFVIALGGMIFLHELGHYLAARWAKIEIEEFGFGFPPRAFGFWRNAGFLLLNGQRVEIPRNFDFHFEWNRINQEHVAITADQIGGELILRSVEYTEVEEPAKGQSKNSAPVKKIVTVGKMRGAIQKSGIIETHAGTLFSFNWLPLGGFVRPKGENDPNIPGGMASANPWKRLVVLFAGPLMNLATAVIIFSLLIAMEGVPLTGEVQINGVMPDSPAQQANIQKGDELLSINGETIEEIPVAITLIQSNLDKPVEFVFERDGETINIVATPLSSRTNGALGVELMYPNRRSATFAEIASGGVAITALQTATILYIPVALIGGAIAPKDARVVGFKGIFDMFNVAVKKDVSSRQEVAAAAPKNEPVQSPTNMTITLVGLLSISLGVMNLLPIPALDGGRILFTMPEILFKRRIPPERENVVNGVAMLLLIALMIFVNIMDIINPAEIPVP